MTEDPTLEGRVLIDLGQQLAKMRTDRDFWHAAHSEDVARLQRELAELQRKYEELLARTL